MLKSFIFILACSISISPAWADNSGAYIGSSLMLSGYNDDDATTYSIDGGYSFNQYLALEVDYTDFGCHEVDESGCLDTTGKGLSAVVKYPINDFTFYGKIGTQWWTKKGTLNQWWLDNPSIIQVKESGNSLTTSVGVSYSFIDDLSLKVEFKSTEIQNDSVDMLSIGLDYSF